MRSVLKKNENCSKKIEKCSKYYEKFLMKNEKFIKKNEKSKIIFRSPYISARGLKIV